jgi:hypothetical protein
MKRQRLESQDDEKVVLKIRDDSFICWCLIKDLVADKSAATRKKGNPQDACGRNTDARDDDLSMLQ